MPEEGEKKPPGEAETKPPERHAGPGRLRQAWNTLNLPLPAQIVGGIVVGLAILLLTVPLSGDDGSGSGSRPGSGSPPAKPTSATGEAVQRDFWIGTPTRFRQAEEHLSYDGDGNGPFLGEVVAVDSRGTPAIYTPRELIEEAASIQRLPVIVVGRVASDASRPSAFRMVRETRIVGRERSFDVYVGSEIPGAAAPGDVIYATGRVAASGRSRAPDARQSQTAYFLAMLNDNAGTVHDSVDLAGAEVRSRAKDVRPR